MRQMIAILTFSTILATAATAEVLPDARRHYPRDALRQEVAGQVLLECTVGRRGRLACDVIRETPADFGFGAAALRASRSFRIAPQTRDGQSTAGGRARFCFVFAPGPPAVISLDAARCGAH